MSRQLLILDLDETLIYASDGQPIPRADFSFDRFSVVKRPFLDAFLLQVNDWFDLAVWTSSTIGYARPVIDRIFPDPTVLKFVWFQDRCTPQYDAELQQYHGSKNLAEVKRLGFSLERTLIIDDSPEKLRRHFGNHIRVGPFTGDRADTELHEILPFLDSLRAVPNVRVVEKRGWRMSFFKTGIGPSHPS